MSVHFVKVNVIFREICNRRLQHCEETLSGLDREIGLFESWFNEANRLKSDTEQGEVKRTNFGDKNHCNSSCRSIVKS